MGRNSIVQQTDTGYVVQAILTLKNTKEHTASIATIEQVYLSQDYNVSQRLSPYCEGNR